MSFKCGKFTPNGKTDFLPASRRLNSVADAMLSKLGVKHFRGLHIRRTDTKHVCNSSVKRVVAKIKKQHNNGTALPLLYWTDERDPAYHTALQRALRVLPSVQSVTNADSLLRSMPATKNNYDVFGATKRLSKRAELMTTFRRKIDC